MFRVGLPSAAGAAIVLRCLVCKPWLRGTFQSNGATISPSPPNFAIEPPQPAAGDGVYCNKHCPGAKVAVMAAKHVEN